jgi:hypothetical protein
MGDFLFPGKFVSRIRIATATLAVSIVLKMVIEGSKSTISYKAKPVTQIGTVSGEITGVLV